MAMGVAGLLAILGLSTAPGAQGGATPIAQIEVIAVAGAPTPEPAASAVRVVRSTQLLAARPALPLLEDDEILTGPDVTVTLLFLEQVIDQDKTVLVGPASQVRLRSRRGIFLTLGRLLANVRGLFDVATARATLGSRSTEFEVRVTEDGSTQLVVLEGVVDVQRGAEGVRLELPRSGRIPPVLLAALRPMPGVRVMSAQPAPTTVNRLEELTIRQADRDTRVRTTSEDRVRGVVDWTTAAVLASQPSFTAKRVIPHFDSPADRARAYRQAKLAAVWRREPGSYETLGKVYSDWDRGARAVDAFMKESDAARVSSATFQANLGEALRMTGRYEEAEERLQRARSAEPDNARALNGLGNVYFALAAAAHDSDALERARELLERCLSIYTETRQGRAPEPARVNGVAWANDGEARLLLGDIARQQNRLDEAAARYAEARDAFVRARNVDDRYAFAAVGAADAAARIGSVATARGARDEGLRAYREAELELRQIIGQHPDLSAAHVSLGDVFLATGRRPEAAEAYTRAASARPQEPAPYLRLAVLEEQNAPAAARYAERYLALEQPALKQGARAQRATRIARASPLTVAVPNLSTLTQEAARDALARAGLTLGQVSTRAVAPANNTVVDQNPKPGTQVSPDTAVSIVVATRPGPIDGRGATPLRVPKVETLHRTAAEQLLLREGFQIGRIRERESSRAAGTVLDQSPSAGRRAPPGSAVDLVIAVPRAVRVPDIVGNSRDRALRALRTAGLGIGAISEQASCEPAGEVLAQQPPKDTRVPAGMAVSLVIAGPGPRPVRVPRVLGVSLAEAERTLREQQLRIRRVEERPTSRSPANSVLQQSPDPYTVIAPDCFVDLTIAVAIPHVTVPNFVDMTEDEALRLLPRLTPGRLGLTLGRITYRTVRARPGTVIDQSPKPNTAVPVGTAVSLVIARQPPPADDRVTMPNVVGMLRRDAEAVLGKLDLRVDVSVQYFRTGYKDGQVVRQSVAVGARVARGTIVQLVVATTIGVDVIVACRVQPATTEVDSRRVAERVMSDQDHCAAPAESLTPEFTRVEANSPSRSAFGSRQSLKADS